MWCAVWLAGVELVGGASGLRRQQSESNEVDKSWVFGRLRYVDVARGSRSIRVKQFRHVMASGCTTRARESSI
uniref:Putative secreted protein n=1 Tax=Anopheles marajoara TaxID=58244 RepID=A0A2M4CDK9_9DIPT